MQNKILNTITLSAGTVTVYENNGLKLHSYATGAALADVAYIVEDCLPSPPASKHGRNTSKPLANPCTAFLSAAIPPGRIILKA